MKPIFCKLCGKPLRIVEDISQKQFVNYTRYIVVCPEIDKHNLDDFTQTVKIFNVYGDADIADFYDDAYNSHFQEFVIKNDKLFIDK